MEAPCAGSGGSPRRSVVGPGQVLAGVELEVVIHGDVGGQHLQIQRIDVLWRQEGVTSGGPGLVSQPHRFLTLSLFSHLSNGHKASVVTRHQHGPQGSSPLGTHTLAQSSTAVTRAALATIGY